ncbi:glyoxalase [Pseudohongiella nitratireducens]|uniref:Glyoxalase n=1 Tax=Pseudohongiella nitratireducens TaxID=1768907 RepID=A0A917GP18_9GAMM|nr:VOC family protein [Pseudohongiella nitratireducens]GGG52637.1 glyoxalase [Pseudohongiella nitratireducens]
MQNKHGDFVWYELQTSDIDAAKRFYGPLLEWQFSLSSAEAPRYETCLAQDNHIRQTHEVGGILELTPEMQEGGCSPAWLGYIEVDDMTQACKKLTDAGGKILMPVKSINDVGDVCVVSDPQNAPFYLICSSGAKNSLAFAHDRPRPGHCAWNELVTSDKNAAQAFYQSQFGWTQDGSMDMGDMGSYDFIRHRNMIGAMMNIPAPGLPPFWNFYFRVANIDKAVKYITDNDGTITQDPMEIPGGEFVISAQDPQGANFQLIGTRGDS